MIRRRFCWLIFLLFFTNFYSVAAQKQVYKIIIRGRVVDEKRNPVPNALIGIEEKDPDQGRDEEFYVRADSEGKFTMSNSSEKRDRTRRLYITFPRADDALTVVDIPAKSLAKFDRRFAGIPLHLKAGKKLLDLGDVVTRIRFTSLKLFVFDEKNNPYYKTDKDWGRNFFLIIRDAKGRFAAGTGISIEDKRNYVDVEKGSIDIELPEGLWQAEIVSNLSDLKSVIGRSEKFELKKGKANKSITIHLSTGGQPPIR